MSWKSIVITGLLCVLASPVWAAPSLSVDLVRSGGLPVLDASGNWQWVVSVTPDGALFADNPPNGVGGSVATEIGFTASGSNLVSISKNATNFPNDDPGTAIAGFPTGNGVQMSGNNAIANLGSDYFTTATAKETVIITTVGPSTNGSLTSTLAWLGAYGGNARIAQASQNFDTYVGSLTKTVHAGDANLDGGVNGLDLAILAANFGAASGKHWNSADYTGDTAVNGLDLAVLAGNFGFSGPALGGGSVAAVPEPTSILLLASVGMLIAGFRRRQ